MAHLKIFKKQKLQNISWKSLLCVMFGSIILCLIFVKFLLGFSALQALKKLNENYFKESQNYELENCSNPAILDFPLDGFTREQRQEGWIILHMILLIYGFLFFITVCDYYFVSSTEQICSNLNLDHNALGATVMAAALSFPELVMNSIGTFLTRTSNIGVSTIVGSAMFNVLAVPACCGLFAVSYLQLDWWPIVRDCFMYLLSILALVIILLDGEVWWYEALVLILAYIGYMLFMFYNKEVCRLVKKCLRKLGYCQPQYKEVSEWTTLLSENQNVYCTLEAGLTNGSPHVVLQFEPEEKEYPASPWCRTNQSSLEFCLRWPVTFLLWLTVPDCRKHPSLIYLTFILSIVWIAGISYVVAFVITIIGDTFNIRDAAMGVIILASGIGMPEAISSIIVTRRGRANMGMCNSLGSNTFNILLSLGLPWFIQACFFPKDPDQKVLYLGSTSLTYASIMLLTSLLVLYLLLAWHNFILNRGVGLSCLIMYINFVVIATLVEMNVFFPFNWAKCD